MDVGLPAKRRCAVETLIGGMKRKLSVAMAFAGGARTVILDEPTAGVDPYARRAIWDLLIKYKKGKHLLKQYFHITAGLRVKFRPLRLSQWSRKSWTS